MSLALYAHPFSSYCQKALIALYEKGLAFDYRIVSPDAMGPGESRAFFWGDEKESTAPFIWS